MFHQVPTPNSLKTILPRLVCCNREEEKQPQFLPQNNDYVLKLLHNGQEKSSELNYGSVVHPITVSSNYIQSSPGVYKYFEYGRFGNPIRAVLESCLASLEGGKHCLAYCSGMAAITSVLHLFKNGDHFIAGEDIYGTTALYMREFCSGYGITTTFVNARDPANVVNAIQNNTKMVFLESPTNPLMNVVDIKKIAELCHKKNKNIIVIVDNSFLTSYFQKPLELGADISVFSLSKFYNGHSDLIMGAAVYNDIEIHKRLHLLQKISGVIPSSFDCFLVNRSLKTLNLRMDRHMKTSLEVAQFLQKHKAVEKVFHPGLTTHPQHELSLKQCSGHSGVFSFYLKGGLKEANIVATSIKVFILSVSLGGFESLFNIPSLMTHQNVPMDVRIKTGISDNLIRLSIGLDPVKDLIEDLDQALNKTL